ncbi:MAG: alpha/beta fold hydrolase [Spirochaetota bacterium]
MSKKIKKVLLVFFLVIVLALPFIIGNTMANMVLHPPWHKPGLTPGCSVVQRAAAAPLCIENPESGIREKFERVNVPYKEGHVKGWFFPTGKNHKIVIFVHGAGADRRNGYVHLSYLQKAGYALVVYDAPNHGVSYNTGVGVTFGKYEQEGFLKILDWVKTNYAGAEIYVIASSAGTSAVILSKESWKGSIKAAVFENPLYSIDRIIRENPITQKLPSIMIPFVYWLIELKAGFSPQDLLPNELVKSFPDIPVLVLHGTLDRTIPLQHGKDLYKNLSVSQKKFIKVEKGRHSMLMATIPRKFAAETLQLFAIGDK